MWFPDFKNIRISCILLISLIFFSYFKNFPQIKFKNFTSSPNDRAIWLPTWLGIERERRCALREKIITFHYIIIDQGWRFLGSEVYVSYISGLIKIHITLQVCFCWKLLCLIYVISQILSSTPLTFKNVMCPTKPSNSFCILFSLTLQDTVARRVGSPGKAILFATQVLAAHPPGMHLLCFPCQS